MTVLADLISIDHRNVRSVNLERELRSASPLAGFVATEQVLDAVRRMLAGFATGASTRAWSVTGPYGAGKSSLAHFISGLLAPQDEPVFVEAKEILVGASAQLAEQLDALRLELGISDRGLIRAAATAEREPISATLTRALHRGAETYWAGRPGPRPRVLKELKTATGAIERGDYPDPRFVQKVVGELRAKAPVVIILDELGKALEFAAGQARESDLYILQQIAESFASSEEPEGAIIALQHLAFEDYASGLSASRRLEWRKIQGRFEDIPFAGRAGHAAALIADSLGAQQLPSRLVEAQQAAALDLVEVAPDTKPVMSALGDSSKAYPLHPTVVPALIELATRFGQHDRSVMAFLTSEDPDAVPAFLKATEVHEDDVLFLRLHHLYDYFIAGGAALVAGGEDAARLREIRSRISDAIELEPLDVQCLKTVGVLNLVPNGSYRASFSLIAQALLEPGAGDSDNGTVVESLERLQQKGLITYRDFASEFRVWQGSDFDVASAIATERERLAQDAVLHGTPISHVAASCPARPVVARRHSQRVETLRYFESRYVLDFDDGYLVCEDEQADGLLIFLLASEAPTQSPPATTADGRPVVVLASTAVTDITDASIDAAAARHVLETYPELGNDVVARTEVRYRLAQAQAALADRVRVRLDPADPSVSCFAAGQLTPVRSLREFSNLLSSLCDETYHSSVVVRNEMLNRRELTSQGAKTRRELLERMLTAEADSKLGIEGFGPDRAMYEAVLAETGVHDERGGRLSLGPPANGSGLAHGWNAINDFFEQATDRPRSLSDVYRLLMAPPYGMKDGPIPVLLAAALADRRDDIFLFEEGSFLPRLGPEHFERLVKTPSRFSVKRAALLGVSADMFAELDELVTDDAALPADVRNATTLRLIRPLIGLAQGLPVFSRQTKRVSTRAQEVRHALLTSQEPDRLLFEELPAALGSPNLVDNHDVAAQFVSQLRGLLDELSDAYPALLRGVAATLREAFGTVGPEHALREELRTRSRHLVEHVIDRRLRAFLLVSINDHLDEQEWLEAVATVLIQKPPTSWADPDVAVFESTTLDIARSFRRLESLHYERSEQPREGFEARRVTVTHPNGTEVSEVIFLERSRMSALSNVVDEAIARALPFGPKAQEGLLALLAQRILADPVDTVEDVPSHQELRRVS